MKNQEDPEWLSNRYIKNFSAIFGSNSSSIDWKIALFNKKNILDQPPP